MEISQELIDKAKACKTADELVALAQENGLELSAEEAELYLQDFAEGVYIDGELADEFVDGEIPDESAEGELADEELDNVAGGGGCIKPPNPHPFYLWKYQHNVQFVFNIGDQVEAFADGCSHHTATCKVTNREARAVYETTTAASGNPGATVLRGYTDYYYLEKVPGSRSAFSNGWHKRCRIEK